MKIAFLFVVLWAYLCPPSALAMEIEPKILPWKTPWMSDWGPTYGLESLLKSLPENYIDDKREEYDHERAVKFKKLDNHYQSIFQEITIIVQNHGPYSFDQFLTYYKELDALFGHFKKNLTPKHRKKFSKNLVQKINMNKPIIYNQLNNLLPHHGDIFALTHIPSVLENYFLSYLSYEPATTPQDEAMRLWLPLVLGQLLIQNKFISCQERYTRKLSLHLHKIRDGINMCYYPFALTHFIPEPLFLTHPYTKFTLIPENDSNDLQWNLEVLDEVGLHPLAFRCLEKYYSNYSLSLKQWLASKDTSTSNPLIEIEPAEEEKAIDEAKPISIQTINLDNNLFSVDLLPKEMIDEIFSHLFFEDWYAIRAVCKKFKFYCEDEKGAFGYGLPLLPFIKTYQKIKKTILFYEAAKQKSPENPGIESVRGEVTFYFEQMARLRSAYTTFKEALIKNQKKSFPHDSKDKVSFLFLSLFQRLWDQPLLIGHLYSLHPQRKAYKIKSWPAFRKILFKTINTHYSQIWNDTSKLWRTVALLQFFQTTYSSLDLYRRSSFLPSCLNDGPTPSGLLTKRPSLVYSNPDALFNFKKIYTTDAKMLLISHPQSATGWIKSRELGELFQWDPEIYRLRIKNYYLNDLEYRTIRTLIDLTYAVGRHIEKHNKNRSLPFPGHYTVCAQTLLDIVLNHEENFSVYFSRYPQDYALLFDSSHLRYYGYTLLGKCLLLQGKDKKGLAMRYLSQALDICPQGIVKHQSFLQYSNIFYIGTIFYNFYNSTPIKSFLADYKSL